MSSVVVHYGELALKGRNRPWFLHTLVRIDPRGACRARTSWRCGRWSAGSSSGSARATDWAEVRAAAGAAARHRQFRARDARRAGSRRDCRRAVADAVRGRTRDELPRHGAARRQAVSDSVAGRSSATSAGACRRRPAGRSTCRIRTVTIRVEVLTADAFFFFEREPGTGGLPSRHERQGDVPAFRRHRLAGGGLAADPARLPRARSSTSTAIRSSRARRRTRRASS